MMIQGNFSNHIHSTKRHCSYKTVISKQLQIQPHIFIIRIKLKFPSSYIRGSSNQDMTPQKYGIIQPYAASLLVNTMFSITVSRGHYLQLMTTSKLLVIYGTISAVFISILVIYKWQSNLILLLLLSIQTTQRLLITQL